MKQQELDQYYATNSYYFSHMGNTHDALYFDQILRPFHKIPNEFVKSTSILEVGSGTGNLISILVHQENISKEHIYSVDLSEIGLRMQKYGKKIRANAEHLPFANNSFGIVLCSDMLEHTLHYKRSISEMYRVLKPGGYLIFRTQNFDCPFLSFRGNDLNIYTKIIADRDAVSKTSAREIWKHLQKLGGMILWFETWASFNWKFPILRILNKISLTKFYGGTCAAFYQKTPNYHDSDSNISLYCPSCVSQLGKKGKILTCHRCKRVFSLRNGITDLYLQK